MVQGIANRLALGALSPAERTEITKSAVDVYKQQMAALMLPSEANKNNAQAAQAFAAANLHDFQRSAEFMAHEIAKAQAGPEATGKAYQELEQFREDMRTKGAEAFSGVAAPPLLKRFTGIGDLGELAKVYGRDNLEKLIVAAMHWESTMAMAGKQGQQNELIKWAGLFEKYNKDALSFKAIPTQLEWDAVQKAAKAGDQQAGRQLGTWMLNGISGPRSAEQEDALQMALKMRDQIGIKMYGPENYKVLKGADESKPRVIKPTPAPAPGAPASAGLPGAVANPETDFTAPFRWLKKKMWDTEVGGAVANPPDTGA
jgi:hypothetical protein